MVAKRRAVAGGALSVVVALAAVGAGWGAAALRPDSRPALTAALDVLPARTTVVGFTDWSRLRAHLGGDVVDLAQERDLSTRSLFASGADEVDSVLGWSPSDLEWEVYGQDAQGAADVVRLRSSVSFDELRTKLRAAGHRERDGIWSTTKRTGLPTITNQVALVPRQRLVVMGDLRDAVRDVVDVVHGRSRSLAGVHAAAHTAQALAGSQSVVMQAGALACESTAITGADRTRQATAAVERAGGLQTYRFSGRGLRERGGTGFSAQELVFAMTFDSAAVAADQARVRARLSSGPFIGRTGPVSDTLRLSAASSDAATTRLVFDHDPDTGVFMTGTGPVLFASC